MGDTGPGAVSAAGPRASGRLVVVAGTVAVLLVLVLGGLAAGSRPWASAPPAAGISTAPESTEVAPASGPPRETAPPSPPPTPRIDGGGIGGYVVLGLAGLLVLGLLVLIGRRVRLRWWSPAIPATGEARPATEPDALPDAVESALLAVEVPDAREAVVQAWLLVGEAAAAAGTPARPAETAAEYARRLAGSHRLPPASLERLAELYREARFSTHPVRPEQRTEARAELQALRTALADRSRAAAP